MIKFLIKDFDLKKNAYKVVGVLPGGFMGTADIPMNAPLKDVLVILNTLSGAVQANFLPLWLMNNQSELPKNEEKKEEVPKLIGTENSTTTEKTES